jgi:hypothetical protein
MNTSDHKQNSLKYIMLFLAGVTGSLVFFFMAMTLRVSFITLVMLFAFMGTFFGVCIPRPNDRSESPT